MVLTGMRTEMRRSVFSCFIMRVSRALALKRARALVTQFEEEPHVNPNTQTREFSLRDPDGYCVTISALSAPQRRRRREQLHLPRLSQRWQFNYRGRLPSRRWLEKFSVTVGAFQSGSHPLVFALKERGDATTIIATGNDDFESTLPGDSEPDVPRLRALAHAVIKQGLAHELYIWLFGAA